MNVENAAYDTLYTIAGNNAVMFAKDKEGRSINHAFWMLNKICHPESDMSNTKKNRWLGYAQALCVMNGELTLDQCKEINKRSTTEIN